MFCAYDRKNTNDDNDGCNDNYDGNFDDNDDKNYQKANKYRMVFLTGTPLKSSKYKKVNLG